MLRGRPNVPCPAFRTMRMFFFCVLCALFMFHGQGDAASPTALQDIIKTKLGLSHYQGADAALDATGKTRQYLVYPRESEWCGVTGGCMLFILTSHKGTWKLLSRMTLVHLPVGILPHLTHGWHDLAISYSGRLPDGSPALVVSRMRFDGKRYPLNPSVPPAEPLSHPTGQSVLSPDSPVH